MKKEQIQKYIEGIKEGDETAFKVIYHEFETPLINHLYRMLGTKELAEEIFQEVMLLMIKKIDFYSERSELHNSFKAWLFRLGTNQAIDHIRRVKRKSIAFETYAQVEISEDVEDMAISLDLNQKVMKLMMELPVLQRTLLNLKINEDLSHFEIATICGVSIDSVKQGLFKGRRNLKNLLLQEGIRL